MMTPTARTLAQLRKDGWTANVVEKYLTHARVRQDLFGIGDVLAIREGEPPLLVQATSSGNLASRVTKSLASVSLALWLSTGCRFACWGWSKKGKAGKRKLWALTVRELTPADLPA